jgi:hypothetical protein
MAHKEPSTDEEIPDLCKKTFLTLDKALVCLWLASGLVITGIGGPLHGHLALTVPLCQ